MFTQCGRLFFLFQRNAGMHVDYITCLAFSGLAMFLVTLCLLLDSSQVVLVLEKASESVSAWFVRVANRNAIQLFRGNEKLLVCVGFCR